MILAFGFSGRGQAEGDNAVAAATGNTPAAIEPSFKVEVFRIEGNSVLPPERFAFLTNFMGNAVTLTRLRQGLSELQLLYRNLGFVTVSVTLPQQRVTNGIINVRVIQGHLSRIAVEGNRFFSSNNIIRALPSLETNALLNTRWFQPELDRANQNPDRQIYPVISPGPDPGTTDLTLKVKDRLPLHGHIELNDRSPPDTPLLRIDSALQYNNLWQLEHQVGIQYTFSPESFKTEGAAETFLDEPSVASYSGFYRIPIGSDGSLRETYDRLPVDFGYNEVTRQFVLPPPTGHPELALFASHSSSETPVLLGPIREITNTVLADISSQFAQQQLTVNNDLGGKFTLPLRSFAGINSSFVAGLDYKTYHAQTFSTNLTYFDLFALDQFGNRILVTNQTIALPANSDISLFYLPISFGWFGSRPDKTGSTSFGLNENVYLGSLASGRVQFQTLAGTPQAGGNSTAMTFNLAREQQLPNNWSFLLRCRGQWSSAPLISNEQFALGGTGGVRGYMEGEAYGDSGWVASLDLRAPAINVGYFPTRTHEIPAFLRTSCFMDYGETYHLASSGGPDVRQWGTGVGFYLTIGQHLDARLTFGWALKDTPQTQAGEARAYFSLGVQF